MFKLHLILIYFSNPIVLFKSSNIYKQDIDKSLNKNKENYELSSDKQIKYITTLYYVVNGELFGINFHLPEEISLYNNMLGNNFTLFKNLTKKNLKDNFFINR